MPMVKEIRTIFDLIDIMAVRLHCNYCGGEAVQSITKTVVPKQCPFCRQDWEKDYPPGNYRGDNWNLVQVMQKLVEAANPRMTIRFEINGDAEANASSV